MKLETLIRKKFNERTAIIQKYDKCNSIDTIEIS